MRVAATPRMPSSVVVQIVEQLLDLAVEVASHRRQVHAPRRAVEQPHAQRLLQLFDAPAEGRLRHVQGVGRLAEAAELCHRAKRLEIVEIEVDGHRRAPASGFALIHSVHQSILNMQFTVDSNERTIRPRSRKTTAIHPFPLLETRCDFKKITVLGALAAAAALACGGAFAAYPEKSITIVVPTAAGGANDAMARVIGQAMSAALKQPVVVDNKAGANGAIASEFVMRAAPDGYTLMLGYIATHAMNPALQKLRYDPVKDFEPVGMVGSSATLMVVNPGGQGEQRQGTRRAAEGRTRQDQLRIGRQRHGAAFRRGDVQAVHRHQHAACALQGIGAGGHRHDRRPDAGDVPQPFHRHALREGRQAQARSAWQAASVRR